MWEIFFDTLRQVLVMLFFIAVGYFMRRKNLLPQESAKTLSSLITNFILPAYVIYNLSSSITIGGLKEYGTYILCGLVCLAIFLAIAFGLATVMKKTFSEKALLIYMLAFSNYSYFGYPLIESVYGPQTLSSVLIFVIPFTVFIYTAGVYMIAPRDKKEIGKNGKKRKFKIQPVVIAIVIGIALGLLGVNMQGSSEDFALASIGNILCIAKSCMSPLSMLLTGIVLAKYSLKELFKSWKAAIIAFVRLAVIPMLVLGLCLLFRLATNLHGAQYLLIPVVISAMPIGMNIVVFRENDGAESAQVNFLSLLMSIATIPLLFMFLQYLV